MKIFPNYQVKEIVQWLFNDETELGDVKRFSMASGGYVVAQMTKLSEGSINIESVKSNVVQEIIRERKAAHCWITYRQKFFRYFVRY